MSVYGGMPYGQPPIVTPGMPMGGMATPGMPYGTPYHSNSLGVSGMSGMGGEYGGPLVDPYPPTIARTGSMYTPSLYGDRRSLYDGDLYDSEFDRGRRRYSDEYDYDRYRRSSSRASRRSRRRDYDDYYYDRDHDYDRYNDRDYYRDSRYYRDGRYHSSSYYPSSSRYYSSRSGRREDMSIITTRNGGVKVLRNGEERLGDKFRRLLGMDPKGVNIVRMKQGESLAARISR